jgi:phosphatidate cytidylyltransferase
MVLIAAALLAAVQGGNVLAVFVAAIATLMFYEWTRIVLRMGAVWSISGSSMRCSRARAAVDP